MDSFSFLGLGEEDSDLDDDLEAVGLNLACLDDAPVLVFITDPTETSYRRLSSSSL